MSARAGQVPFAGPASRLVRNLALGAFLAPLLCPLLASRSASAQQGGPSVPEPPVFTVQVEFREGRLAIVEGSARIDWRDGRARKVFEDCALDAEAVRGELQSHLQKQFAARPRALEELLAARAKPALQRELEALAQRDPATQRLWQAREPIPWLEATRLVNEWSRARRAETPSLVDRDLALAEIFAALHENNRALAEGPLLPRAGDDLASRARQGLMDFEIAPPLRDIKLRTTANVAQWEGLRGALATRALADQRCRLWYRPQIADALQDYLEVRGLATSSLLAAKDLKDARALGSASTEAQEHANIRITRPHWRDTQRVAPGQAPGVGGRILLEPDPLIAAVYLRGSEAQVQRALYLLLPSEDARRVRDEPRAHLCAAEAVWLPQQPRPPAVQLPLDDSMPGIRGSTLAIAKAYVTRRALAERAQRLAAIGFQARLAMFHQRLAPDAPALKERGESPMQHLALLIVEPMAADEAAGAPAAAPAPPADAAPGLLPCATPRDAPQARPECPAGRSDDRCAPAQTPLDAQPVDAGATPATPGQQQARRPPRNHVELGAHWRSGKPLRFGGEYRRDGLTPGDVLVVGLGQQRQTSGHLGYSRDFVGFEKLGRRLQLSGRVYSEFTPERPIDNTLPDERREGAELRGVVDLWRDRGGSFGQAEFGVSRSRTRLDEGPAPAPSRSNLTLADAAFAVARSQPATPASLHTEARLALARGRADGAGFGRLRAEGSAQGMLGRLEHWVVRGQWARLSGTAPLTEHIAFGGPDSVRGYRDEQAVGRRAWSAQAEYWRPLPWQPADDDLARLLRRSVALALFADTGGVAASPTGFEGRKSALGLGLRWRYGHLLTLRLDAARPVGDVAAGDRQTRLQFGVTALNAL